MSAGAYLLGAAELAFAVAALLFAAVRLRARIVPGWDGAPARLAEAVLGLALLIWISELLGAVGLFREAALLAACLLVAVAAWFVPPAPAGPKPSAPPVSTIAVLVAIAVAALVFAHWGFWVKRHLNEGIGNFDSLWYHMPFSADMVQSGSLTGLHFTDPLFLNWFYPQNSETLHAVGIMLLGRDELSLFINLGWLGLTLLAAWCIGRPFGQGAVAVVAAALLLESHTLVVREPGAAKNDVAGTALLLSSCALLLNGWLASRARASKEGGERSAAALAAGPLALAGLAAGLAIGTKLTVAAAVAALTVGIVVLAPGGGRRRALGVWLAPLLAGGVFWYLRNMVQAGGNPLPWVRHIGPLTLPGPDRMQEARPSFAITHYATDTHVWRAYFAPGMHEAFGVLWPVVVLAGVAGAAIALWRGRDGIVRLLGAVALFAMLAYLFTPLGAAGQEGLPVAFSINLRFVVPALILGLVLLAALPGLGRGNRSWWLLGGLLLVLVVTDRSDAALRAPERAFGVLIAVLLVLIPALLLYLRAREALSRAWLAAGLIAIAAAVVAIGYPVQRDYFRDRWRNFNEAQMSSAYRWARDTSGLHIGLAGTTAGFYEYGFFGVDDSNRVRYLGKEGDDGSFAAIPTCAQFRTAVNDGGFDYLVTTPFLNFNHPDSPIPSPEAGWIRTDRAVRPVVREGPVTVWRLRGRLDPAGCARLKVPTRAVPRLS